MLRFHRCALRNDAGIEVAPERDQEFSREGDDADLAQPTRAVPKPALIPLRQRAVGLIAEPPPRDVDGERPDLAVAGFRHALLAMPIAALIRRRGEAGQCAHLTTILKLSPAEELHDVEPRALHADPAQHQ